MTRKGKEITKHDRQRLRDLYVRLDRYDHPMVKENIERQIKEIKAKYENKY